MDASNLPVSISLQPGQHLSVDSRPGTATTANQGQFSSDTSDFWQWEAQNVKQVSHYVTSPFKQGQQRKYQDARIVYDVSSPLKSEILQSITVHKQNLASAQDEERGYGHRNQTFHSRTRQGRLLPLLGTPTVKGPVIKQCIGITSSGAFRKSTAVLKGPSPTHLRSPHSLKGSFKSSLFRRQASIHRNSFNSNFSNDKPNVFE